MDSDDGTSGGEETTEDSEDSEDSTSTSSTTGMDTTSSSTTSTTGATTTGDPTGEVTCEELTIEELFGAQFRVPGVATEAVDVGDDGTPDHFRLEFWEEVSGVVDLSMGVETNYETCSVCVRMFPDWADDDFANPQFFQSQGTVEVDAATPPSSFEPDLTFTGVRIVEVNIDPETAITTPVDGGDCFDIVDGTITATIQDEVCDDGLNDNFGLFGADCGDATCAEDTVCTDACGAATAASVGSNPGDTTGGGNVFQSSCNAVGGLENIFTFTPAADGLVILELTSDTDQGISVRETCADITTELVCADSVEGGTAESTAFNGTNGTPVAIIVDGFGAGEEGTFDLNIQTPTLTAESEDNNVFGDANALTDDGFTATMEAGGEDWFAVTVSSAPNSIRARTFGSTSDCDAEDTVVEIIGTDGSTVIEENDDASGATFCSDASAASLADGTYYVRVTALDDTATFDYSVVIETN